MWQNSSQAFTIWRQIRQNNIIIYGLETNNEALNLLEFLKLFFKNHVKFEILSFDINNAFLLKNARSAIIPIKVEFVSYLKKEQVLKSAF